MTPEQLKASILQQAMEGKLVKQDPRDEPASVLVKKIADGKARLIKEKKIKRTKKLPAITNDEKPFDIPDSWEWVKLGEIGNYIQRGRSPKYDKVNHNHPIISQKCIQWSGITLQDAKFITQEFFEKLENYRFVQKNDILWNSTGTGTVGRANVVREAFEKVPVDSHVTLIRVNRNVDPQFIYYYLISPIIQNNLDEYLTGTTKQKELGLNSILNVVLPIPPINEQKRIVAKIEKLMPLVDKYAESYNQLTKIDANFNDRMKQSILQYAMEGKLVKQDLHDEPASVLVKQITDEKARLIKEKKIKRTKKLPAITNDEKPFDIPDSWEWVHLDEISYLIGGKSNQIREKDSLATGKYKVVSQSQKKFIGFTNESSKVLSPQTDCIVFGDHTALVKYIDFNFVIGGDGVKVFKTLPGVSTMYLYYVLKYNLIGVAGLGGYSRHFKYIKDKLIPLPPLSEQKRIVDKIEQFMKLLDDKTL
ncbi:restriction endonuclease subunit S [Limosilactobacillus agrestimuris]|uniref:restriction endonuclease subunit S n=1 Tax=Limosilactobacillus agrestimuris TaxID=2941331 RepID=UPI00203DADF6|nr:restriction endonuclease subunit S [Limosilactobacillus agrestimuris]